MTASSKRFPIGLDRVAHGRTRDVVSRPEAPGETKDPATEPMQRPVGAHAELNPAAAAMRARMVRRLESMAGVSPFVLRAMDAVPRELFVDAALAGQAYEDTALPIGHGQTISKPSVVARMLSLLTEGAHFRIAGHLGRCLEIGTGCGYQSALLSLMAPTVLSIERVNALHNAARDTLGRVHAVRRSALRLVLGDGRLGHPPNAPYNTIVSAAVGESLPQAWLDQLAVGGRLVAPLGEGSAQTLVVVDRTPHGLVQTPYETVRFVPLESGVLR